MTGAGLDTPALYDWLNRLLLDERVALRKLDAVGVDRLAERKAALCHLLAQRRDHDHERLAAISTALRHNAVLLVHARNAVRDELQSVRPSGWTG